MRTNQLRSISVTVILLEILILISNQFQQCIGGTLSKGRLQSNENVYFENCTVNDLRNIREIHQRPRKITIKHCELNELPNALFLRFNESARDFQISDSQLEKLQDTVFNGLNNLETLNLARNNLNDMQKWSSEKFFDLHQLDLHKNRIQEINVNALENFPNLLHLNLAENHIKTIQDNAFSAIIHLKTLNLEGNQLERIEQDTFKGLKKLKYLYLQCNRIDFIDPFAFTMDLTHLKTLRLDSNRLILFDGHLMQNLPRLTTLNLSTNLLTELKEKTFQKNLELKLLDISFNYFQNFEKDTFTGLETLEVLNVSNNLIDVIHPLQLREFINVRHLDLSGNNITYLFDGAFKYLPELQHLNLSRNAIDEIQGNVLGEMDNLKSVDLSSNQLNSDDFINQISMLDTLEYLDMTNNKFETLNTSQIIHINNVQLADNPWRCEWLAMEMLSTLPNGIHFGRDYVIQSKDVALSVPGIECTDEQNIIRHIVILQPPTDVLDTFEEIIVEDSSISYVADEIEQSSTFNKIFKDKFDFKACLIWTAIGIIVVYGVVQVGKILSKKSERQSDVYRRSQQDRILQDLDEYFCKKDVDEEKNICKKV